MSHDREERIFAEVVLRRKGIEERILERGATPGREGVVQFAPTDDTQHKLAKAAAAYAFVAGGEDGTRDDYNAGNPPPFWPYGSGFWRPESRRKDMVTAIALLLMQIVRDDKAQELTAARAILEAPCPPAPSTSDASKSA